MQNKDRRSGSERRALGRHTLHIEVEWQGAGERTSGSVSDISYDGCFVLCSGDVEDGEPVRLFVPLADGMKVQFEGVVANHVPDIGFGLKFAPISAAQRELLAKLFASAR